MSLILHAIRISCDAQQFGTIITFYIIIHAQYLIHTPGGKILVTILVIWQ